MLFSQSQDPLFVREENDFATESALEDPETLNLIERREDELVLLLLEEGVSEADFRDALNKNPEGFISWVELSIAVRQ